MDKILRAAGGKWNRARKGHLFEADAEDALESLITTGQVVDFKKAFDQFETPDDLADRVVAELDVQPGMNVLEPSAGRSSQLVFPILGRKPGRLLCYEFDERSADKLDERICNHLAPEPREHVAVICGDFLLSKPTPVYHRVGMNPPFSKRADVRHVLHAWEFLRPGGMLVSIMGAGIAFRSDRLTTDFRAKVEEHGGWIAPLPPESFKSAGTGVNTVLVKFPRLPF